MRGEKSRKERREGTEESDDLISHETDEKWMKMNESERFTSDRKKMMKEKNLRTTSFSCSKNCFPKYCTLLPIVILL